MVTAERKRSPLETVVRLVADALMVNAALMVAVVLRYIVDIAIRGHGPPLLVLQNRLMEYAGIFWILTAISLCVFYASGFYTHGRFYRGRYKALVVSQAVTLSYLVFGFVAYLSHGSVSVPRSILLMGWLLTCALLIAARLWTMLWRLVNPPEAREHKAGPSHQRPRRVLVIGGAGYIGSALLPKLLKRGYHVRLLDLFLFGRDPIAHVVGHPNLEIVQADFRNVDKIVQAMREVEEVIHLGAIVGDPACSLDQELTVEVNLMATRMIAEVAKGSGIRRFSFASTCSVYGACDHILNERSGLNPISLYARSKLASEKILLSMANDSFSPVILRFGTVYGLSGRTRFDLVINLLTAKAVREGKITVFGGGQWRPFLHVDDVALAVCKATEAPTELVHGQIFNVGSNEQNYRLVDVANLIHKIAPKAEVVDMGADTDFRNYRVDFTKISTKLGFVPQWTVEAGIEQVIAALENGEVSDYRDPMYSNVKFLSEENTSRLIRRENGWAQELIKQAVETAATASVVAAR